jgi:Family of unknown function (DUF6328)
LATLSEKVKTGLDETRILILGAQIFVGFQFTSAFQDGFDDLSAKLRWLDVAAVVLMVAAMALLIAPGTYHRIAEHGRDSERTLAFISAMAGMALFPFALSIGCGLTIAFGRISGGITAALLGFGFCGLALFAWFGFAFLARGFDGQKERVMSSPQRMRSPHTPLHAKIEQMLTEARVILPGAQAILGFQLSITLMRSFADLSPSSKLMHAAGLCLLAVAIILLMAPAAYHRIVYAGEDSEGFHRVGSIMVLGSTFPLAFGLGCDLYVVLFKMTNSAIAGTAISILATFLMGFLWFGFPVMRRRQSTERLGGDDVTGDGRIR